MKSDNKKICYLKMVMPFTIVYISMIFGLTFIKQGMTKNSFLDIILISITAFGFVYGVLAIIRDLKEFGAFETLRYWWDKIVNK